MTRGELVNHPGIEQTSRDNCCRESSESEKQTLRSRDSLGVWSRYWRFPINESLDSKVEEDYVSSSLIGGDNISLTLIGGEKASRRRKCFTPIDRRCNQRTF
ncbi:hypothetical protein RRG08_047270 [Elysia crispata]|uniref:Uncharacterized protein n=1 Tax=Elysia crispata TaxID=231223 RepID=A0AAE0ZC88_9GAST|nr:hypothetical protein RRG08_047270 [Elysia crispata]